MVKGTNRTVIEINDTGNKMFEKIILFVSAEYGNVSNRRLKCETEKILMQYSENQIIPTRSIRAFYKRKRRIAFCVGAVALAALITALVIFFNNL